MLPQRIPKKPKRATRWRSQAHLNFVRSFHCAMPGCVGVPTEAAHVRVGSGAGMGQKPDDWRAVPLCKFHHGQQHQVGENTFWNTYTRAAGQTETVLIDELCKASPKAREIEAAKREREHG